MWSRVLRRPSGLSLHRTVRFARKYNGQQNQDPHKTYFQDFQNYQQSPPKPRFRLLRSTLLATSCFALGIYAATFISIASLDEEDLAVDNLVSLLFKSEGQEGALKGLMHIQREMEARQIPPLPLEVARSSMGLQAGFGFGVNWASHDCQLPSNMPCEDAFAYGGYSFFEEFDRNWDFFAIFDGHAGPRTANALTELLPGLLGEGLWKQGAMGRPYRPDDWYVVQTIKKAFKDADGFIMKHAMDAVRNEGLAMTSKLAALAPAVAGSCALVALYDPVNMVLRVANTGDSRAVLGRWDGKERKYVARPMSVDQTGFNQDEVERLKQDHPGEDVVDSKTGRVHGLAVSRAFGDSRWKWPQEITKLVHTKLFGPSPRPNGVIKTPPYLTAEPEIMEMKIQEGEKHDFVILASDGLWDHISSQDAVTCVHQWLEKNDPAAIVGGITKLPGQNTASTVLESALKPGGGPPPYPLDDEDTYYDESERCLKWKVSPKHFVVEDENCAAHLIQNALGGSRRNLFCGIMTMHPPLSRHVRDDITVKVVFFGQHLEELAKQRFEVAREQKKQAIKEMEERVGGGGKGR